MLAGWLQSARDPASLPLEPWGGEVTDHRPLRQQAQPTDPRWNRAALTEPQTSGPRSQWGWYKSRKKTEHVLSWTFPPLQKTGPTAVVRGEESNVKGVWLPFQGYLKVIGGGSWAKTQNQHQSLGPNHRPACPHLRLPARWHSPGFLSCQSAHGSWPECVPHRDLPFWASVSPSVTRGWHLKPFHLAMLWGQVKGWTSESPGKSKPGSHGVVQASRVPPVECKPSTPAL